MVSIIVSFVILFGMSLSISYLIGWKQGFNDAYDMYEKEGEEK